MQNQESETIEYSESHSNENTETSDALIHPTPDNPPWNGWVAFGVWVASVVFIFLFPNLFLLSYIAQQKLDFSEKQQLVNFISSDSTAVILSLAAIIPAHFLTLLLCWAVVTRLNKYSFRETLGWKMNGFKIWYSFVIFFFFLLIALLLQYVFGDVENEFERMIKTSRTAVYLVAFFAVFTAPLVEEVIYRGLLYSAFQRRFGVVLAVVFVTILFTIVHVPQYSDKTVPDYASVITLLLLSLTLTLIRVWTNNLLPCIVLHTVINGIQSVFLVLGPYLPNELNPVQESTAQIFNFFK